MKSPQLMRGPLGGLVERIARVGVGSWWRRGTKISGRFLVRGFRLPALCRSEYRLRSLWRRSRAPAGRAGAKCLVPPSLGWRVRREENSAASRLTSACS